MIDEPEPDRRDARRDGHLLVIDQLSETSAVLVATRKHQLGARRRPGKGEAPAIGVEHRYRDEHGIPRGDTDDVGAQQMQRVEIVGAVCIGDALGCARRPRCEAQASRCRLVKTTPLDDRTMVGKQVLETPDLHGIGFGRTGYRPRLVEQDDVLDRRAALQKVLDQRRQPVAHRQHAVARLPDHCRQMRRRQSGVQRVADDTRPHRAVPAFHMRLAVPGQRREIVAGTKTERGKGA